MRAAHRAERFLMTISGIVMVLAALVFGAVPGRAVARGATTTATPLVPGTVVHAASCEQAPPQLAKDRATYSAAELARYGLHRVPLASRSRSGRRSYGTRASASVITRLGRRDPFLPSLLRQPRAPFGQDM